MGARAYVIAVTLLPGLLIAFACLGFGDACLWSGYWARRKSQVSGGSVHTDAIAGIFFPERLLLAFAFGIGVLSSFTYFIGFTSELGQGLSVIIIGMGLFNGFALWRQIVWKCKSRFAASNPIPPGIRARLSLPAITVAAILATAIALIAAVSLTPPIIFDVTEYHLGAWTDYYNAASGEMRFVPMPHNFYARFPFPIESLYFLGLSVAPYTDAAPKVFNAICVLACGLLAALIARRMGAGRGGMLLSALVAIAHPVMFDVSIDAMIDAPTALLVASSVFAAFIAAGTFQSNSLADRVDGDRTVPSLIIPAFFLFGTAVAAKYTVAQIYLLPWLVLVLPLMLRVNWRRRPLRLVAAVAFASIPCVLWLGKNVVYYGNPLEPFFVKWFRPLDVVAIVQEKFYVDSHFPQSPLSVDYWLTLVPRLREFQAVILVACTGWMFRDHRRVATRILLVSALAWLGWNTVRDSQNRFLLPAMVLLAPVAVCGALSFPTRFTRRFVATLLVLFTLAQVVRFSLTVHQSAVSDYLLNFAPSTRLTGTGTAEPTPREEFYTKNLGDLGDIINATNRTVPPDSKILLIYEARPYLFKNDTIYNVVWDDSVFLNIIRPAKTTEEAWALLRQAGITHILVNRQELLRYIQQYARVSQLRRLGLRMGDDPRMAWSATEHPENLYPPFYLDAEWSRLRPLVQALLMEINAKATLREGLPPTNPAIKALEITVSPVG